MLCYPWREEGSVLGNVLEVGEGDSFPCLSISHFDLYKQGVSEQLSFFHYHPHRPF